MTGQVETVRHYCLVFAALMVLTAATIAISYFHLGRLSIVLALLIAASKASLVVWFFMHVRHSAPLTKVAVAAGLLWLVILLVLTLGDYFTRTWLPAPAGWQKVQMLMSHPTCGSFELTRDGPSGRADGESRG